MNAVVHNNHIALLAEIGVQAVEDFKQLLAAGVIKNGDAIDPWPQQNGKPVRVLGHYHDKTSVQELLYFLRGDKFTALMRAVGIDTDQSTMLSRIGLSKTQTPQPICIP